MTTVGLRLVAVRRVSTEEQALGWSTPRQGREIDSWAIRSGHQIIEHVDELGESGSTVDELDPRTGLILRSAIRRIEELYALKLIDGAVATEFDRWHRNDLSFERWAAGFIARGGRIFTVAGGEMTNNELEAWLKRRRDGLQATEHAMISSHKSRRGHADAAAQGRHCKRLPYGTRKGAVKGVPEKDPVTWPWLLRIFEQMALQRSPHRVAVWLERQEAPSGNGGAWTGETVRRIVTNRWYLREIRKRPRLGPLGKQNAVWGAAQLVCSAAQHDCVVDEAVWLAAQPAPTSRPRGAGQKGRIYLFDNDQVFDSRFELLGRTPRQPEWKPVGKRLLFRQRTWANGAGATYTRLDRSGPERWCARWLASAEAPTQPDDVRELSRIAADWLEDEVLQELQLILGAPGSAWLIRPESLSQAQAEVKAQRRDAVDARIAEISRELARVEVRLNNALEFKLERDVFRLAGERSRLEEELTSLTPGAAGDVKAPAAEAAKLELLSQGPMLPLLLELLKAGLREELRDILRVVVRGVEVDADDEGKPRLKGLYLADLPELREALDIPAMSEILPNDPDAKVFGFRCRPRAA